MWRNWATSAQNLIEVSFGTISPHSRNFKDLYQNCNNTEHSVRALFAVFQSACSDFEAGFAGNLDLRISGEVFGDFVALAKQSLSEGHKDVAAVLACAALEDALKRFALANGLTPDEKSMTDVINSLKGAGLVSGAQKSLLDVMPRIRNAALHADWSKISEPDVNSVIGFVEQFLLSNF
ncbi:MAG: DUF4145 domain-containing protein [Alphaproteobacteria bacterium]|nr:DUF4145 domain-containing protein [Alphaproteobacteria bacterium]